MENEMKFSLKQSIENFLENEESFVRKKTKVGIDFRFLTKDHLGIVWDCQDTIYVAIGDEADPNEIQKKISGNTEASKKCFTNSRKNVSVGVCYGYKYRSFFFQFGRSQLVHVVFCHDRGLDYISEHIGLPEKKVKNRKFHSPDETEDGIPLGI